VAQPEITSSAPNRLRALWEARVGGIGLVMGLMPHVLHHAGFLVGTALIADSGGTAIFGLLGLLFSLPMLMRLHKRFGTRKAPALALGIFAVMFTISTYVIGPAMSRTGNADPSSVPTIDHNSHHLSQP